MKKLKILKLIFLLLLTFVLVSCDSKIRDININGNYYGTGAMSYEAVVEKGTITIYSTSFFNKEVYWYGTCHADELDEENKLISKRIEKEDDNGIYDDIFGFRFFRNNLNESRASEKEILFTENSLTFIYDFSGMSVSQVTLYKEDNKKTKNDSNAIEVPETETYEPYIVPRADEKKDNKKNDDKKKDDSKQQDEKNDKNNNSNDIVLPEGDIYNL